MNLTIFPAGEPTGDADGAIVASVPELPCDELDRRHRLQTRRAR
jgi:hypothetical protein